MSFIKVRNEKSKTDIISKWMKDRQKLKQQLIDEKIGRQEFQRDIAIPTAEPITQSIVNSQKKTDEKQNKIIQQFTRNQQQITSALNALPEKIGMYLPGPETDIKGLYEPEQIEEAKKPIQYVNPDEDIPVEIIRKHKFKLPSELLELDYKELDAYQQSVGQKNKELGVDLRHGKVTKEEMKVMKNYNDTLRSMVKQYNKFHPNTTGTGLKNPYKLREDYTFGNLSINPQKLLDLKLEAFKNGKKIISKKIDYDFINLITKRFNSNKKYSNESLSLFNKLIKLSGLPTNGGEIKYYKKPEELAKRLQLLIASKEAGNNSIALDNEIVTILNKLYTDGDITKEQYKLFYNECI